MRFHWYLVVIIALFSLSASTEMTVAQQPPGPGAQVSCPALVETVLQNLDEVCSATGRNEACYGNVSIEALPHAAVETFNFEQVGDIENVANIQTLRLNALNPDNDLWGVALMRLQANIPGTVPGQNVTFLLFGDTEMTSAVDPDSGFAPMQAFYLRTGIGNAACEEAPENGLLVQTPAGAGQVTFSVNGMDVSLGSTAFMTAQPGGDMRVSMLEGSGALRLGERYIPVLAGTRVRIPLGDDLLPDDFEVIIEALDMDEIAYLPLDGLDYDDFDIDAYTDDELELLLAAWENGDLLCGEGPFPDCDDLPFVLGGEACPLADDGEDFDCDTPFDFEWGGDDFDFFYYDEVSPFEGEFFDDFDLEFDDFDELDIDEFDDEDFDLPDEDDLDKFGNDLGDDFDDLGDDLGDVDDFDVPDDLGDEFDDLGDVDEPGDGGEAPDDPDNTFDD